MCWDYIRVLEEWCDKCFFVVNDHKSGILRVGTKGNLPPPNVAIKGSRILLFNEQDPNTDEDEINDFKYLGILLTSDGSWNKVHDYKLKKSKQTMGRFWKFFRYANISTKIKLRVAHALVLSHLSYGEEIMQLSQVQINQIDSMHASVLRTILQLPKFTSLMRCCKRSDHKFALLLLIKFPPWWSYECAGSKIDECVQTS